MCPVSFKFLLLLFSFICVTYKNTKERFISKFMALERLSSQGWSLNTSKVIQTKDYAVNGVASLFTFEIYACDSFDEFKHIHAFSVGIIFLMCYNSQNSFIRKINTQCHVRATKNMP